MQCCVGGGEYVGHHIRKPCSVGWGEVSMSVTILGSHAVLGEGREYIGHHIRKPCSVGWGEAMQCWVGGGEYVGHHIRKPCSVG